MSLLHFLTIFVTIFYAIVGIHSSTIPPDISKLFANTTNFISKVPASGSSPMKLMAMDSRKYISPVCNSYSTLNGGWNNGQYDSVTCNFNSLDRCVSVVGDIGSTKYIFLGCSTNILLSEGYDPWSYYIEDGCKNNFIVVNGQSVLATVCACQYNFCNTERFYNTNGISSLTQKISLFIMIITLLFKLI